MSAATRFGNAAARRYQPLVPAAVAFIAGILAADYLGGHALLWCAAAFGAALFWGALYLARARPGVMLVPLMALVAAVGAGRYRATVDPPADDVACVVAHGWRVATVEGVVVRSPRRHAPPQDVFLPHAPYYSRTTMTLDAGRVRLSGRWMRVSGRMHVSVRGEGPEVEDRIEQADDAEIAALGDRVQVLGFLAPFRRPANPGGFDVARYMHRQGVRAALYANHWEAVRVVEPAADKPRAFLAAMRRVALRRLQCLPSAEGRAVVSAIMLGRRDLLDLETGLNGSIERDFLVSGAAHFLAVSGLHVGMVGGMVLLLARLAGTGRRLTAFLVALVVLVYALMTELQPSVLRAAVFIWILCLGWAVARERLFFNSLAAAALVVVAIRPGDLFMASFQLSFGIMLGLMCLCRRIEVVVLRRDKESEALSEPAGPAARFWRRLLRPTTSLSLAAPLVGAPLVASRFHLVAWLSPITSIILTPLVALLLASGLILVTFGWVAPGVSDLLAVVPDGLARAIGAVVRALARVPGGHFYTAGFSWPWLVVVYGLLGMWLGRERLGLSRRRLGVAALAALAVFVWTGGHRTPDAARATILAVGNGNTNLLELPNGRNLLYDAGSVLSYTRAAETTTAPALWSRRIGRIDACFISHSHFDHFKDILPLVERFGIRKVFVPPTFLRGRLSVDDAVVEALLERGVEVTFFGAGDRLAGTGGATVRALWPRGTASQTDKINDGSLVLEVAENGRRLLLTGDLEADGIAALLAREPDLSADAILWPHHGGDPEAVRRLAAAAGAKVLVISASRTRRAEHEPTWVAEQGITCYHTAKDGAVTLTLQPGEMDVATFLDGADVR